ncbi:MAG: molybdopterin-dependent oxidoreductase [Ktedonobacterales bacterium]|nr:molybdopterin-dependent oxidoreductase [Ktedonobacterales bacterium]
MIVLAMEVVALGVFWPVLPEGLFGDPLGRARLLTALSALLVFLTYVAVTLFTDLWLRTAWDVRAAAEQPAEAAGGTSTLALTRRRALEAAGVVVVAVAAGGVGVDRLLQGYLASSNLAYEGRPTPDDVLSFITPTKDFYVVSKNALDPTVIADHWRLELGGLVRQSRAWTYEQVRALPSETRVVTFECIANGVGGHLLSTAEWRGVSLQSLLALAGGATPGGAYVVFFSTDGYASSLPLRDLLEARTMLAWQMNGAPLADRHGFPLRVVVPGRYGEQSPKWLTRIEIANRPFKGFYQSQGWNDKQLETMSRIDAPRGMVPLGSVTIAGVAFAGIRGIQRVEVSADGGVSWHEARLLSPRSELSRSELSRSELSRSDTTWVFWTWAWLPPRRGVYTLIARATDGRGAVQAATERGTVPQGATGWPRVSVRVG